MTYDRTESLQNGRGSDLIEARKNAKDIENKFYAESTSRAEYDEACNEAVGSPNKAEEHHQTQKTIAKDEEDPEPPLPPTATTLGAYKHAAHHGNGLFSEVFRAAPPCPFPNSPTTTVALKVTTPSTMVPPHDSHREARILQSLHSPHITLLLDTFSQPGGRFVLVLPFLSHDLSSLLHARRLTPRQTRSHLRDLFTALSHLHEKRIIHRDVKPSNLLLRSPDGPAYLSDLGIAWSPCDAASEAAREKISDVGTTCYRPPEVLFGSAGYGCELDLWAAGCVMAEAAGGLGRGESFFDAGDLGSELRLIQSIFGKLGTPDLRVWPEAANLPDWRKVEFHKFPPRPWEELLPGASTEARDLVSRLVRYEGGERLAAAEVLKHPYFRHVAL